MYIIIQLCILYIYIKYMYDNLIRFISILLLKLSHIDNKQYYNITRLFLYRCNITL